MKLQSLSPNRFIWLLFLMLTALAVYCFMKPLVLSVDSAFGFLAYKGTILFKLFNFIQDIPPSDIGRIDHVFMSWWSPGQWVFPGLLNYFLGIRLGVAALTVTLVSVILGMIGYYRIFLFFNFPVLISQLSLLIILSSSTFYYSFIIYQGGEILEFAFFPWFLLYVFQIRRISTWNLLGVAVLFLLCFVAKTTLLIYCLLVVIAKIIHVYRTPVGIRLRLYSNYLPLLFAVLVLFALIGVFYLSPGPRPAFVRHFHISAEGILVPLTAPLCSILSIQEWIERIVKMNSRIIQESRLSVFFLSALYIVILGLLFWIIRYLTGNRQINESYKNLLFILYAGLSAFFLFAYSFDANIDFNSRHFKLMGYLFIPGLLTFLSEMVKKSWTQIMVILFCLVFVVDIIYLKEKWTRDRYLSVNYFYRNCEPPPARDKLDMDSYTQLLDLDQHDRVTAKPLIFFVESSIDIAIDLRHPFIIQRPDENIRGKIYKRSGPDLMVCISKSTLQMEKGILQFKFPGYRGFKKIRETNNYLFFLCTQTE